MSDKSKLLQYCKDLMTTVPVPKMDTVEGEEVMKNVYELQKKIYNYVQDKAFKLDGDSKTE